MGEVGIETPAVVEDDRPAREVGVAGEDHAAAGGGSDGGAHPGQEVGAAVRVPGLAVEDTTGAEPSGRAPRHGADPRPAPEPLRRVGGEDRGLLQVLALDAGRDLGGRLDVARLHPETAGGVPLVGHGQAVDAGQGFPAGRGDAQHEVVVAGLDHQVDADESSPRAVLGAVEVNGAVEDGPLDRREPRRRRNRDEDRLAGLHAAGAMGDVDVERLPGRRSREREPPARGPRHGTPNRRRCWLHVPLRPRCPPAAPPTRQEESSAASALDRQWPPAAGHSTVCGTWIDGRPLHLVSERAQSALRRRRQEFATWNGAELLQGGRQADSQARVGGPAVCAVARRGLQRGLWGGQHSRRSRWAGQPRERRLRPSRAASPICPYRPSAQPLPPNRSPRTPGPDGPDAYPPNRVTPNTRARMMTMVSAVNTARLNQLNQTTGCDG